MAMLRVTKWWTYFCPRPDHGHTVGGLGYVTKSCHQKVPFTAAAFTTAISLSQFRMAAAEKRSQNVISWVGGIFAAGVAGYFISCDYYFAPLSPFTNNPRILPRASVFCSLAAVDHRYSRPDRPCLERYYSR